jgi:hypothetical protein
MLPHPLKAAAEGITVEEGGGEEGAKPQGTRRPVKPETLEFKRTFKEAAAAMQLLEGHKKVRRVTAAASMWCARWAGGGSFIPSTQNGAPQRSQHA